MIGRMIKHQNQYLTYPHEVLNVMMIISEKLWNNLPDLLSEVMKTFTND